MNWDQIEGNFKQLQGKLREKWAKLTDDDFQLLKSDRDKFIGRLQEKYGLQKEEAHRQVDEIMKSQSGGTRSAGGH